MEGSKVPSVCPGRSELWVEGGMVLTEETEVLGEKQCGW